MPDETLSELLARYITSLSLDTIPTDIVGSAKLHILDSLGCLLAGSALHAGKLAYELAVSNGGAAPALRLPGSQHRAALLDAVEAMSVAAHCGEMDDIHGAAGTCVGAMIVPGLITLAQNYGGSGQKFVEGVIAGYETTIRGGLSIDAPRLFARGWWPSTICGALGVAAAGAKFLDWNADKSANALGIAALHSGGMLTGGNEGATARHLAFGHAARNGIQALAAAEKGFTGPKRAFEDPRGFCVTLCAEPQWHYLQSFDDFHLAEVAFKPYPCARQLHAGVEALLKILRKYSFAPDMIGEIELLLPTQNAALMNRPSITKSHAATVGSGQYVMAVTAMRREIDLESFGDRFLTEPQVHRLARRVKVSASSALDRYYPKYWSGAVTVKLDNGESHSQQVIIPKGESGNPMSTEEIEEKFLSLAEPVVGEERALRIKKHVLCLEESQSLQAVIRDVTG